jgi:hypothetical protein
MLQYVTTAARSVNHAVFQFLSLLSVLSLRDPGASVNWGYACEVTPMLAASATWATLPVSAFLGATPFNSCALCSIRFEMPYCPPRGVYNDR